MESIAEELEKDLETLKYSGKTVTVKFKLHTYESVYGRRNRDLTAGKSRAFSVKKFISMKEDILPVSNDVARARSLGFLGHC